jgi:hypothetical protein
VWAGLAGLAWVAEVPAGEGTTIYRCVSERGVPEFRQRPCAPGVAQERLEFEEVKVGWEAFAAPVRSAPVRRAPASRPVARRARAGQKERCFRTAQRLESVNRQLRRGYRAGRGADLRHRRRQYEAYLDEFCD